MPSQFNPESVQIAKNVVADRNTEVKAAMTEHFYSGTLRTKVCNQAISVCSPWGPGWDLDQAEMVG